MIKKKKIFTLPKSMLAASLFVIMTSCGGKDAQQQAGMSGAGAPAQVDTYKVALGSVNLNTSYPATIKGKMDIEIRPQISGFITKVCVDEGQRVSKGQTLFIIDQVQLEAAVRSAQAAVAAAQSQVATAQLTANNQKSLLDKNIISNYQYETAALALQSAKAQLSQAKASLVNAKKNLSYSVVKAPCAGVVGAIPNREGSLASPSGQALTTISDNAQVYAYFSLNEKQILELTHNGAQSLEAGIRQLPPVQFRLADGTVYAKPGRVSTVSGVLDSSTGSAQVRALFPNENGMLHSGATGEVLIPSNSQNVILVPQKATYEVQDIKYVYVVGDSSKAVSKPITVLPENDGVNYVVTKGLNVGDVVVTEGVGTQVKEGTVIQPKSAAAAKAAAAAAKK